MKVTQLNKMKKILERTRHFLDQLAGYIYDIPQDAIIPRAKRAKKAKTKKPAKKKAKK